MKCSKCGREYPEGTKFCEDCGIELVAEVQPAESKAADTPAPVAATETPAAESAPVAEAKKEEKKESKKEDGGKKTDSKKLIIGVVAAVVVVLLLVVLFGGSGGKADYQAVNKKAVIQMLQDEDVVCVLLADGTVKELKTDSCNSAVYSMDRTTVVFLNDDDEVMIYKNGKLIEVGVDDVSSIRVSAHGDTVAYIGDVKNGSGTLYLYDVKSKKIKEVADDVRTGTVVLSPNGKTVAFVGDYEDSEDFKGYYSVNGSKVVELGKEKRIFAIADKATYIYYKDGDRLYAQKGKKDAEKLATDIGDFRAYFNADLSQMLYTADGKTYITEKAKEKVKVSNDNVYGVVLPQDSVTGSYSTAGGSINFTFVKTFAKQLISSGSDVCYVKPNFESVKVASNVSYGILSRNGKKLCMIGSKQELVEITDFAKGGKKKELTNEGDLVGMIADNNLKNIYVVNEDEELMLVKSGKKTKKIADDITAYALSGDGATCYFVVEDETLYYSKSGGKKVKIKEEEEIDLIGFNGVVLAMIDDGDSSTLCSVNGKKLKELYKSEN